MQFGPILVIEQQMFNTALAITNIKNDKRNGCSVICYCWLQPTAEVDDS